VPPEVELDGETVAFSSVERLEGAATNVWFRVAAERPVRRGALRALFDAAGLKVSRVMLVHWGPLALPRDLPRGRCRDLDPAELDALLALAGRSRQVGPAAGSRSRGAGRSSGLDAAPVIPRPAGPSRHRNGASTSRGSGIAAGSSPGRRLFATVSASARDRRC